MQPAKSAQPGVTGMPPAVQLIAETGVLVSSEPFRVLKNCMAFIPSSSPATPRLLLLSRGWMKIVGSA